MNYKEAADEIRRLRMGLVVDAFVLGNHQPMLLLIKEAIHARWKSLTMPSHFQRGGVSIPLHQQEFVLPDYVRPIISDPGDEQKDTFTWIDFPGSDAKYPVRRQSYHIHSRRP